MEQTTIQSNAHYTKTAHEHILKLPGSFFSRR